MGSDAGGPADKRRGRRAAIQAAVFVFVLAGFAVFQQLSVQADSAGPAPLGFWSTSFTNGGAIPRRFTCDGDDTSPGLDWSKTPPGTRSFALVMHDPDAPVDFTHWLAWDIPANVHELKAGASSDDAMPRGSAEGLNGFRRVGYAGPCPPPGKPHHYVFTLYALDVNVHLEPGATRAELEAAIRGHILAEGRMVGVYGRALF